MGRPSLNVKRISAYVSADAPDRIDNLVGGHKRSEFIREAVDSAIRIAEMTVAAAERRGK